jgi:hypothetical protein
MTLQKYLTAIAILVSTVSFGQITGGTNYFSLGNTVFNKPFTKFDQYPDTAVVDSTSKASKGGSVTAMLSYHVAVSRHISIGLRGRFLNNSTSTYGISCFGGAVRYHFGIGPDEPRPKKLKEGQKYSANDMTTQVRRFYNHATEERLKSLFFVEAGYMVGNLRYDSNKIAYSEISLQAGALLRAPLPDTQLLRHFGLELSAGVFGMSDEFEKLIFRPNVSAGLLIFLDKKYSSTKKIPRKVERLG